MRWRTNTIDVDESMIIGLFLPPSGPPVDSDDDSGPRRRRSRCPCCPQASSTRFSTALALFEHMREIHFPSSPTPASATSSTVNFETQKGRKEAIKHAFRKANADEKSELLLVAFKSLNRHPVASGLKVCVCVINFYILLKMRLIF